MPGLGGDPEHFHWLADGLSRSGWPVAMLEHPGSDSRAIQELLEGRQALMVRLLWISVCSIFRRL